MRITIGYLDALVPDAVAYLHCIETHAEEQAHMAVTKIVYAYALNARRFRSAIHFVMKIALREIEYALVRLYTIDRMEQVAQFLNEEIWH